MLERAHSLGFEGYTAGDVSKGDDFTLLGDPPITGLVPERQTTTTARRDGGAWGGAQTDVTMIPRCRLYTPHRDRFRGLLAAMQARYQPGDESPLTVRGILWGDEVQVRCYVRPLEPQPIIEAGTIPLNNWRADLSWLAVDSLWYSDVATVVPGGPAAASQALAYTNPGTKVTRSGRAWTLTITAATNVVAPYVQIGSGPRVTWAGYTLTAGATIVVDKDRHTRRGSLGLDGRLRTGHAADPDWPVFRPGVASTMTVGCQSGTLTAVLTARGTY